MKKRALQKMLAAVLALTLVLSAAGAALADDGNNAAYTYNETNEIEGDFDEIVIVAADDGQTASLTITGDVTADGGGEAGLFVNAQEEGTAAVHTGDVTNTDGTAVAVIAEGNAYADALVGDVKAAGGDGVKIETNEELSRADVTTGDITADGTGVSVFNRDGTVNVSTGSIEAGEAGVDYFYDWYNDSEEGWTIGPPPVCESDITVDGEITVKTDDPESLATGVRVGLPAGEVTVEVNGDISVTAPGLDEEGTAACGIDLMTATEAKVEAKVDGNITVTGMDTWGAEVWAGPWADWADENNTTVGLEVNGDISAKGTYATGIEAVSGINDTATVSVEGDITVAGDEWAAAVKTENIGGNIDVTVNGDLISSGNGIMLVDRPEEGYQHDYEGNLIGSVTSPAGQTKVEVVGDVKAEETGINVNLTHDDSRIDVIVDGTVEGKDQAVLVSKDTITDNLTLTVWEIKQNDDGNIAERITETDEQGKAAKTEADRELEKKIQYIIRIEDNSKNYIATSGTKDFTANNGEKYQVANEGDKVLVKLSIPKDKELVDAFWNIAQSEVGRLLKDSEGNYYLEVPR